MYSYVRVVVGVEGAVRKLAQQVNLEEERTWLMICIYICMYIYREACAAGGPERVQAASGRLMLNVYIYIYI